MGDLEMQRLKAVTDAARAMRMAASITSYYGIEADHPDSGYIVNIPVLAWKALVDALNVLDRGKEMPEMEYDDGPWASTGSNSNIDVAGYWHFPGPDVTGMDDEPSELPSEDEIRQGIRIRRLKQGFLVEPEFFTPQGKLAFSDALDAAEWLLSWLGFEDEIVESVRDILAGLWDADELMDRDCDGALTVTEAAQAYVETGDERDFIKLVEAVKKWRATAST